MPSPLIILASFLSIYCFSLVYRLLINFVNARKSGFPYIIIPWDQDHLLWLVVCVPLRPLIKKYMPKWIYDRLSILIQGHEFYEKLHPYEQFTAPQGNNKSYALVTVGNFEVDTRDPEIISEILRRPREFEQMDLAEAFLGKFGSNVLTSNGDSWARQRKIVASVINERISKTVFDESIRQTQGLLDEVIGDQEAGETNLLFDMMRKITMNVLSGAGMGAKVEWNHNETAKPSPGYKMTYNEAIKHVIAAVVGPIILPQWLLSNYPSFIPGYETLHSLSIAMKEFPIHTRNLLNQERHRTVAAHGEARSNILSQLLHASEQDGGEEKGSHGLSEDEMVGNLFIFTAAGFDTTANTLGFALVLLSRYPKWQEWIFEEIDSIMPHNPSMDLDYVTTFQKITRIQALLLEVLRLFPAATRVIKVSTAPQGIHTSRGLFSLPAKSTIYINTVCLHLDPDVWRNLNLDQSEKESETDELEFRPTRWICDPSTESPQLFKPPKGTYIPWSAGPRVCPGQKMAQVEFTAIFLKLFNENRIEAVALKTASGELETRSQVEERLDARMKNSILLLTLQMNDIYDVEEGQGLKLRLRRRR
ncbi:cytochrome P450 [Stipitochalara longipes BDJ]|nr:cytochrome P450 [Stipitochalara longipes BDJ]